MARSNYSFINRISYLVFISFLVLVAFTSPVSAVDNEEQDDEIVRLGRIVADFAYSVIREKDHNIKARQQLEIENNELTGSDITPSILERARLDMETDRSKYNSLIARLSMRDNSLDQLNIELQLIEKEIKSTVEVEGDVGSELLATLKSKFEKTERVKLLTEQLLIHLQELVKQVQTKTSLSNDRFNLLQRRFTLSSIKLNVVKSASEKRIKRDIDYYLSQAAKNRNSADAVKGDTEAALVEKKYFELKSQISDELVELKQSELKLVQLEQSLNSSVALTRAESIPVNVLRSAKIKVNEIYMTLQTEIDQLIRKYDLVNIQRSIILKLEPTTGTETKFQQEQIALFDSVLKENVSLQNFAQNLLAKKDTNIKQFDTMISLGLHRELTERRVLPPDFEGWQHLAKNIKAIPMRVADQFAHTFQEVINGFQQATATKYFQFIGVLSLLAVFFVALRWLMNKWLSQRHADSTLTAPIAALNTNLILLLAPTVWILVWWLFSFSSKTLWLLLIVFSLWPAIRFPLNLARSLLLDSATYDNRPTRLRFYRSLRWAVILVVILASMFIIAHTVVLLPAVADIIDRLSMLCFLLIMIPTLQLRSLIISSYGSEYKLNKWARFAGAISFTVPLAISICAIIGLLGYVNLAWSIAQHLSLFALVLGLWRIAVGVLRELTAYTNKVMQKRLSGAEFWLKHFVMPLYKISTVAVAFAAGYFLFWLFEWSEDTPVISAIPIIMDTQLVKLGETALRVQDAALAAFIIFLVFWAGSWSKQVSYRLAYVKISDLGIRQSLSTFTQYVVIVIGLMLTLKVIGLDLTAMTVFAGALGVGIGFGLQTIINNFVSGILLLAERPLRVTDVVTVDNFEGEVTKIGIRSLSVKTFDNQEVIIPNSSVITKPFTNWTRGDDIMRTLLMVGISYKSNPQQAMDEVLKILKTQTGVLSTPAPKVLLWDFAESAVMLRIHFFSNINGTIGRGDLRSIVLMSIWNRFEELGIEIPFPQRDVHVHGWPQSQDDLIPKALPGN